MMSKISNIIFDIGNVILNFDHNKVIEKFTKDTEEQKFILENIINSPEWLKYGLIDTGYVTRENAIKIVQDRTNHKKDELIYDFWMNYNNYASVNMEIIDIIKKLNEKNYKIFLLSNMNAHTVQFIKETSDLFDIVDGYILSYRVHQIKPYEGIYKTLIERYSLKEDECIFIDDNAKNIETGKRIGMLSVKVEPDDIESVEKALLNYLNKE